MTPLAPGDVAAVQTKPDVLSTLIHLGAWFRGQTTRVDHIVIAHHTDDAGTYWGIEARPGGVGWVDLRRYAGAVVRSNAAQPKTGDQRRIICDAATGMLGVEYDWDSIIGDAAVAFGLERLWHLDDWGKTAPAHVVCSSLAAWIYRERAGLAEPDTAMVSTTPADWWDFFVAQGWT